MLLFVFFLVLHLLCNKFAIIIIISVKKPVRSYATIIIFFISIITETIPYIVSCQFEKTFMILSLLVMFCVFYLVV